MWSSTAPSYVWCGQGRHIMYESNFGRWHTTSSHVLVGYAMRRRLILLSSWSDSPWRWAWTPVNMSGNGATPTGNNLLAAAAGKNVLLMTKGEFTIGCLTMLGLALHSITDTGIDWSSIPASTQDTQCFVMLVRVLSSVILWICPNTAGHSQATGLTGGAVLVPLLRGR